MKCTFIIRNPSRKIRFKSDYLNSEAFFRKLIYYIPVKLIPACTGIFYVLLLYKNLPVGEYVEYSISLFTALLAAQIGSGWLANALLYYLPVAKNKSTLVTNSLILVFVMAVLVSLVAASISALFISDVTLFGYMCLLCFFQSLFGLVSSIHQSEFLIKDQIISVVLQCVTQLLSIYIFFEFAGAQLKFAIVATTLGYLAGGSYLCVSLCYKFKLNISSANVIAIKQDFINLFKYGAPLVPWMLGVMITSGVDRISIGYFELSHGDAYLSMKDILVGASGLISMPLLMLIHPLIVKEFSKGRFAVFVLQGAMSLLTICFSILWVFWQFVGIEIFQELTGKDVLVSVQIIFLMFVSIYFSCLSVYVQKRLEVHKKISLMAQYALVVGVLSVPLSFVGAKYFGLVGVSLAAAVAQGIYLFLVGRTLFKKINLQDCFYKPLMCSVFYWAAGGAGIHFLGVIFPESTMALKALLWCSFFIVVTPIVLWRVVAWRDFSTEREGVK